MPPATSSLVSACTAARNFLLVSTLPACNKRFLSSFAKLTDDNGSTTEPAWVQLPSVSESQGCLWVLLQPHQGCAFPVVRLFPRRRQADCLLCVCQGLSISQCFAVSQRAVTEEALCCVLVGLQGQSFCILCVSKLVVSLLQGFISPDLEVLDLQVPVATQSSAQGWTIGVIQ